MSVTAAQVLDAACSTSHRPGSENEDRIRNNEAFFKGILGLILGSDSDGSSFCIADLEGHGWKANEARRSHST